MPGCRTMASKPAVNGCSECYSGFYITQTKPGYRECVQCGFACTSCAGSPTNCSSCLNGFVVNSIGGGCQKCTKICIRCNGSPDNCTICASKYYLKGNRCVECSDNYCRVCGENNQCEQCIDNYHKDPISGKCVLFSINKSTTNMRSISIVIAAIVIGLIVFVAALLAHCILFTSHKKKEGQHDSDYINYSSMEVDEKGKQINHNKGDLEEIAK